MSEDLTVRGMRTQLEHGQASAAVALRASGDLAFPVLEDPVPGFLG